MKQQVRQYWESHPCEAKEAKHALYSREYFEDIEEYRNEVTPDVHSFAQFTRWHGKKVLEIGVGAGTDFIQWVRAGSEAYGIDLTSEAIHHTGMRLKQYGLIPKELKMGDAENLEYPDNMFDLVYSWGVLHHSPDTEKAISEAVRVCKQGGRIKLMLYNRYAAQMIWFWLYVNFIKMKFPKTLKWCLWNEMESIGTKAYTENEIKKIFSKLPVRIVKMQAKINKYDLLWRYPVPAQWLAYILVCLMGFNNCGFFRKIELEKL